MAPLITLMPPAGDRPRTHHPLPHHPLPNAALMWGSSTLAALGLLLGTAEPSWADRPISPNSSEAYAICSTDLQGIGLTPAQTAMACAQSIRPAELSTCATTIATATGLTNSNLSALKIVEDCYQVRRPQELGLCVADIHESETFANLDGVVETCRRSLLPLVLSNCAIGLAETTELPEANILDTCLRGESTHFEFSERNY